MISSTPSRVHRPPWRAQTAERARSRRRGNPRTEKVKTAKGPLIELKIKSAEHNPRFLLVSCSDAAVFLTAFMKKTQKLRRTDIKRADERFQTIKDECQ